jgi:hypothetical protein
MTTATTTTTVGDLVETIELDVDDLEPLAVCYFREASAALARFAAVTGNVAEAVELTRIALGLAGELNDLAAPATPDGLVADSPTPWLPPDVGSRRDDAPADAAPTAGASAGAELERLLDEEEEIARRTHAAHTDDTPAAAVRGPDPTTTIDFVNCSPIGDVRVKVWQFGPATHVDIATRPNDRTPWSIPVADSVDGGHVRPGRNEPATAQRLFELDDDAGYVLVQMWNGRVDAGAVDIQYRTPTTNGWQYPPRLGAVVEP